MKKSKNNSTGKKQAKDSEKIREQKPAENAEETTEQSGAESADSAEELKRQLSEAEDKFVRSRADLENYRKRAQRETAEAREYTKVSTVEQFLPVFDHFQMAMQHVGENSDFDTLKQGMDMILNEFSRTFENLGVKQIDAEGQAFDPNIHEAMAQEPSDEVPAGHVLRQWKCGYRIGERLLRPATVVVSAGPPEDDSDKENESKES